jgi:hypothetical protein
MLRWDCMSWEGLFVTRTVPWAQRCHQVAQGPFVEAVWIPCGGRALGGTRGCTLKLLRAQASSCASAHMMKMWVRRLRTRQTVARAWAVDILVGTFDLWFPPHLCPCT